MPKIIYSDVRIDAIILLIILLKNEVTCGSDFIRRMLTFGRYPYANTKREKIGSFFSRALAYEVNGFPR